jgi:hypothetical protein
MELSRPLAPVHIGVLGVAVPPMAFLWGILEPTATYLV